MSWQTGAGFRIVGHVVRTFVAPSGKFAAITIAVPSEKGGERKHEVRAFSDVVPDVKNLAAGMTIQVKGTIDCEALKGRDKQDVQVDGRTAWVEKLTAKKIDVEPSSKRAAPAQQSWDDDRIGGAPSGSTGGDW